MIGNYPFDILGNVVLVKFSPETKVSEKKKFAQKLLKETSATTILEKVGKFSGRLRKQKTKFVAGEKTKEIRYRENDCLFRFNIDTTYFSPRLSNERKEIASQIKKDEKVLVMFAGVAPFPIVIAKNSRAEKIYSNEINREANKYAKLNIELNKLKNKVFLLPGDIKKVAEKIGSLRSQSANTPDHHPKLAAHSRSQINKIVNKKNSYVNCSSNFRATLERGKFSNIPKTFDVIVMPRPNLKDSFLKYAFALSKKGTRIFYYGFCKEEDKEKLIDGIKEEARTAKKKIKILETKKAGEIGPHKIRLRVDFRVV